MPKKVSPNIFTKSLFANARSVGYFCEVKKKLALLILDGLGYGNKDQSDAVFQAETPYLDYLLANYPNGRLEASGEAVGLPHGQMGNSEVGHINLGAGRTVYQDLGRISLSLKQGSLERNEAFNRAIAYARQEQKSVHLMGLLSDGGVHAHIAHLKDVVKSVLALGFGGESLFLHAFLDGRDTDPHGGVHYLEELEGFLHNHSGRLASVIGRYYAMDRDQRWERTKSAYDLLVHGIGRPTENWQDTVQEYYDKGISDEFMIPLVGLSEDGEPMGTVKPGDVVICFNFRTDRARQLTMALTQQAYPSQQMRPLELKYLTMTSYDDTFKNVDVIFQKDNLSNTLGEVLSANGLTQTRIAETEKYPHVTFFFSGGRESEFPGEERLMIPSPKVPTYDLLPEMSAFEIARTIGLHMETKGPDFICLNFANPDMVGHTGDFQAVKKAVETVDLCTRYVVETGLQEGYSFIILADHGNAEFMLNPDGSPNTAHTSNPVPVILLDDHFDRIVDGKLGDIAPSILHLLDQDIPAEMTGNILIKKL